LAWARRGGDSSERISLLPNALLSRESYTYADSIYILSILCSSSQETPSAEANLTISNILNSSVFFPNRKLPGPSPADLAEDDIFFTAKLVDSSISRSKEFDKVEEECWRFLGSCKSRISSMVDVSEIVSFSRARHLESQVFLENTSANIEDIT
jgi:hypothetical protein